MSLPLYTNNLLLKQEARIAGNTVESVETSTHCPPAEIIPLGYNSGLT